MAEFTDFKVLFPEFSAPWPECFLEALQTYINRADPGWIERIRPLPETSSCYSRLTLKKREASNEAGTLQFYTDLERHFALKEYWFSNPRWCRFAGAAAEGPAIPYALARYVGYNPIWNLGFHIIEDPGCLYLDVFEYGN